MGDTSKCRGQEDDEFRKEFCEKLYGFKKDELNIDVHLVPGRKTRVEDPPIEIPAHKVILRTIQYFEMIFQMSEITKEELKSIDLDMDQPTLEAVLKYIYTGQIEISAANFLQIFEAAKTLSMDNLRKKCYRSRHEGILSESNWLEIFRFALQEKDVTFLEVIYRFIAKNLLPGFPTSKEFFSLEFEELETMMTSPSRFFASREEYQVALLNWNTKKTSRTQIDNTTLVRLFNLPWNSPKKAMPEQVNGNTPENRSEKPSSSSDNQKIHNGVPESPIIPPANIPNGILDVAPNNNIPEELLELAAAEPFSFEANAIAPTVAVKRPAANRGRKGRRGRGGRGRLTYPTKRKTARPRKVNTPAEIDLTEHDMDSTELIEQNDVNSATSTPIQTETTHVQEEELQKEEVACCSTSVFPPPLGIVKRVTPKSFRGRGGRGRGGVGGRGGRGRGRGGRGGNIAPSIFMNENAPAHNEAQNVEEGRSGSAKIILKDCRVQLERLNIIRSDPRKKSEDSDHTDFEDEDEIGEGGRFSTNSLVPEGNETEKDPMNNDAASDKTDASTISNSLITPTRVKRVSPKRMRMNI